jgi:hypothetical protein
MPLPSAGQISFADINLEMQVDVNFNRSLNDTTTRTLFGVPSGQISMSDGYGKVNRRLLTINIGTVLFGGGYNLFNDSTVSQNYIAGKTDVVVNITGRVYTLSTDSSIPTFDTGTGWNSGDTIRINISSTGAIHASGGNGAYAPYISSGGVRIDGSKNGLPGADALRVRFPTTIDNQGNIVGGGGGGGAADLFILSKWQSGQIRWFSVGTGSSGGGGAGGYRGIFPGQASDPAYPSSTISGSPTNKNPPTWDYIGGSGGGQNWSTLPDPEFGGFLPFGSSSGGAGGNASNVVGSSGISHLSQGDPNFNGSGTGGFWPPASGGGGGGAGASGGSGGNIADDSGVVALIRGAGFTVYTPTTRPGGVGGAGGRSIIGNSNITWVNTGTRFGSIAD